MVSKKGLKKGAVRGEGVAGVERTSKRRQMEKGPGGRGLEMVTGLCSFGGVRSRGHRSGIQVYESCQVHI